MKLTGKTFVIERPGATDGPFWTESMNEFVGRSCVVTRENASAWVYIDADKGLYLWHKEWLKPVFKAKKLKKRTLQDEMMDIDVKADADISKIKRAGFVRRRKIREESEVKKRQIKDDNTSALLDGFLKRNKEKRGETKKTGWSTKAKVALVSVPGAGLLVALLYHLI
tara:strand:- start:121881 stop:122384 length:504 start_codon:yes stop_codon:yes gene_type:complete